MSAENYPLPRPRAAPEMATDAEMGQREPRPDAAGNAEVDQRERQRDAAGAPEADRQRRFREIRTFPLILLGLSVLDCARPTPAPAGQDLRSPCDRLALTADTSLDEWPVDTLAQVGFASLGILHRPAGKKLVLYDLRPIPPRAPVPREARVRPPALSDGLFMISRLRHGNLNRLGGAFNQVFRRPSSAAVSINTSGPAELRGLTFTFDNTPPGFAGFWIHLFETRAAPADRVFTDASQVPLLTFAIRGANGGEALLLKVADRKWERKGDALPVGPLDEFLPAGRVTRSWQQAWIPLDRLPARINRKELASLVLLAVGAQRGRIYLRDLAFAGVRREMPPPVLHTPPSRPLRLAMWLWETKKLVKDPGAIRALAAFCQRERFTDLFLQLPLEATRAGGRWRVTLHREGLPRLITALHHVGVRVEALDGDPHLALEQNHDRVLASIAEVIRYNREVPRAARFEGVRYDNEPYLLPGFAGNQKEPLLRQYIALLRRSRAATSRAGLTFGVDIPFWFDALDAAYRPVAALDGRPFSELIIDEVDSVSIMDYRTQAYGPDGVIAHAQGELRYAASRGKQLFVGLESVVLPDETMQQFARAGGEGARLVLSPAGGGRVRVAWYSPELWRRCQAKVARVPGVATLSLSNETFVPASKLTFADRSPEQLREVMEQTQRELLWLPSFGGFAIHSYESYRPWLDRASSRATP